MKADTTPPDADAEQRRLQRLEETLWVIQARGGDTTAFTRLVTRYEQPIFYYLKRFIRDDSAAADTHQEIWLDAYRGLRRLATPEAFCPWLYRIAHAKAMRHIREEMREKQHTQPLEESHEAIAWEAEDTHDAEAVHQALDKLPSRQREVLTLFYLHDLSLEEIAAVLDCPLGTLKSRLHHARLALRPLLRKDSL